MEYDEEEEYVQSEQAQPDDIKIDNEDAPYLDLRDDREWQAYSMLKDRVFQNTWQFDPDLLMKIGMDFELYSIRQNIGWEVFRVMRMVLAFSPSNFFAHFKKFPKA